MHTNNRDAYRSFAAKVPDLPLFVQPWYLDVVCKKDAWNAAIVQKNGRVVAALPFFMKQKWGWQYISTPPLCKHMGPYLLPEYRSLKWQMRLYAELIEQLPPGLAAFEQNFHYDVTNWLPFYWASFKQTTLYSYVLPLDDSEEMIFQRVEKNYRNKIRAAESRLELRDDLPITELHRLMRLSFERQGLNSSVSLALLQALFTELSEHRCCKLLFAAEPQTGALHSAALLVWDQHSAYYLLSGDDPNLRASGAGVLLQWAAIRYAKNVAGVPLFDFEGSMLRAIEQGRRDFGAQQRPYFRVRREWSVLWKWGKWLRRSGRGLFF